MSKKYTSLEHTIRNIHSKQLNERKLLGTSIIPKSSGVKQLPTKPVEPTPGVLVPVEPTPGVLVPVEPTPGVLVPKKPVPVPKPVETTPKPVEIPKELPSTKPVEIPKELPSTKPVEIPKELPSTKPLQIPKELPSTKPLQIPKELPSTKPVETPAPKPSEKPVPSTVPGPKQAEKPTQEPNSKQEPKPESKPEDKGKQKEETPTSKQKEKDWSFGFPIPGLPSGLSLAAGKGVGNYGPGTSLSDTSAKRKTRLRKESLEEMGIVGTDKYQGNAKAFYTPISRIGPGHSQESKNLSGKRRLAKQKGLNRVEESGYTPNQGNAAQVASWPTFEETDRKEIEYVSRPDTAKSPKDKKSKLGRQSAVLTRIIDEEKTLLEFFNVTLKKKKEQKRKKVEAESGETQVVFNPKLKTAIQENKIQGAIDFAKKYIPSKKTSAILSTGALGGSALGAVSPSKGEEDNVEGNLGKAQLGTSVLGGILPKLGSYASKAARVIPGVQTATGLGIAGYRAYKGDLPGAGLALGSAIPGPVGWGFTAADIARDVASELPSKEDKPPTGATPAPKPETTKSGATPAPSSSSSSSSATPASKPVEPKKPEEPKINTASVEPKKGESPSVLSKPSDMGGYSDKQIVKTPSYPEPEKKQTSETKPQSVQQPKPQPRQPQTSRPSQPESKSSNWGTEELNKYREGKSSVFGNYESGGPSKIKAKENVLKAFMRSRKK